MLYDMKMREYREKVIVNNWWNLGAKTLEFIKNVKNNLILFLMFCMG